MRALRSLASPVVMVAAFLVGLPAPLLAQQKYPERPVRIVVGFSPGSATDITARMVGAKLSEMWKQPVVIDNRPGAGGSIAAAAVAKAAPDGYTLLMVSGTQTVNETLYARKNYRLMQDLTPVAPLIDTDLVLVVHPSVPAKSVGDLLALARAKPGTLNYGSSGPGSNYHMAGELLRNLTGVDIVHVPYKGSTGARNDILSGQIQILFDSVPTMAPTIQAGMVRALGTSGKQRSPTLPDVPTLAEAGVPGFQATLWVGLMAPASTPRPIIEKLNGEITKIVQRPDVKVAWEKLGASPLVMTQPQFATFMQAEVEKWAKVIAANKIAPVN